MNISDWINETLANKESLDSILAITIFIGTCLLFLLLGTKFKQTKNQQKERNMEKNKDGDTFEATQKQPPLQPKTRILGLPLDNPKLDVTEGRNLSTKTPVEQKKSSAVEKTNTPMLEKTSRVPDVPQTESKTIKQEEKKETAVKEPEPEQQVKQDYYVVFLYDVRADCDTCLLYTSPSPRDRG